MNVRTLCLSILYDGEATGYEIRKRSTEGECAYFVEASFGSIYPALAKLEEESLLTSRVEHQSGRPAKKIYAITEAGRRSLLDSLFDDLGSDVFRSEFLLFARFAGELPRSLVEARVAERIEAIDAQLHSLNELLEKSGNDHSHDADAWVIRYGLSCLEVARRHIETHMHELIAMARPDGVAEAAE